MSGINILLDTNIALYVLNGDVILEQYLQGKVFYVSFINELELLGYKNITISEETKIELFLEDCAIIDINEGIKEITKQIRRNYALKLPDAIVAATAIFLGVPLLSADKQFGQVSDLTFVLYEP
ncbi:type II toxin-antitoxin system VapC family toxin [Dyadobacter frigoris]|uniref:Type II toxin-antitoxin system VapC family toxin n=1 Tax=Dyadobacter frigoris TaxID=2576211 RepID=A0A4U6D8N9_9BACT|nr:type II toxin-antitoxin system VapC family toxin [Dyadobacter frigoris]TKT93870.1 type II toxin-antitoxin system VapC family toxin [Dyadobacter frigoris]GLU50913.1 motility twitching protein PilT [Dyadobacter frigoris]